MTTYQIIIEILLAVKIGAAIELIKLNKMKNEQKYLSLKLFKINIGKIIKIKSKLYARRLIIPPKEMISQNEKSDVSIEPYPNPKKVFVERVLIIPGIINESSENLPEVKTSKKLSEKPISLYTYFMPS